MNLPAEIKVELHDGVPMVSSLQVAERFNKRHADVLKSIRSLDMSDQFAERNLSLSDYQDATGRRLPMYWLTKDGFLALAMGMTGAEAAKVREQILNALTKADEMIRRGIDALDVPLLLEMAAKQFRQMEHERDTMADEAVAARSQTKLLISERTKDIDKQREWERKFSEAQRKLTSVAKHAWQAKSEVEELMRGAGDMFAGVDAENVMPMPVPKKRDDIA